MIVVMGVPMRFVGLLLTVLLCQPLLFASAQTSSAIGGENTPAEPGTTVDAEGTLLSITNITVTPVVKMSGEAYVLVQATITELKLNSDHIFLQGFDFALGPAGTPFSSSNPIEESWVLETPMDQPSEVAPKAYSMLVYFPASPFANDSLGVKLTLNGTVDGTTKIIDCYFAIPWTEYLDS